MSDDDISAFLQGAIPDEPFAEEGGVDPPASSEPDDSPDLPGHPGDQQDGKSFDFHATRVFLTYSNLPESVSMAAFMAALHLKVDQPERLITKYICGRERHFSGAIHFHILVYFVRRLHYRDPRCFDVLLAGAQRHPNFRLLKKATDEAAAIHYASKDGDFVQSGVRLFPTSTNYVRRKQDWQAWCDDNKRNHGLDVHGRKPVSYPLLFPDGVEVSSPTADQRVRLHLVMGTPGCGKTKWLEQTLGDSDVFLASHPQYPLEGYEQEQVIVFDDYNPEKLTRDFLIRILNVTMMHNVHLGWCRGTGNKAIAKRGQSRLVIILCNQEHAPAWFHGNDEAMMSRTLIHRMPAPTTA